MPCSVYFNNLFLVIRKCKHDMCETTGNLITQLLHVEMESLSVFPLGVVTVLKTSASEIPLGEDRVVNIRNTEPWDDVF